MKLVIKCPKCGKVNGGSAKFCFSCGTALAKEEATKFVGKERKCPYCGAELSRDDLKCPFCKGEIYDDKSFKNDVIAEFSAELAKLDSKIAIDNKQRNGFQSWNGGAKFWWVVLNIFTLCIPLVIYLFIKAINLNSDKYLTDSEKEKINFIRNYNFTGHISTAIDLMLICKSNLEELLNQFSDSKFAFANVWKTKAQQLKTMFSANSESLDSAYNACMELAKKINGKRIIRIVVSIIVIIIFAVFIVIAGSLNKEVVWKSLDVMITMR